MGRPQDPERAASIARMVDMCDTAPCTKSQLMHAFDAPEWMINHWTYAASKDNRITFSRAVNGWITPRLGKELGVCGQQQDTARVPLRPVWDTTTPVVEHKDGVIYTTCPAPRHPYHADPSVCGRGAISGDWMARRQGVAVPSRVPGLTGGPAAELPVNRAHLLGLESLQPITTTHTEAA
ncbi:MAG: hypothetical protein LW854_08755 [Rubrivivax sp.]|jgi:hypothetical protein|nr:hypothetical protein [Rubrivivax sp.]